MKVTNRLSLTAGLLMISGSAFGHAGHDALGDGVHIEYFLAAGAAVAVGIYILMRHKRAGHD